MSDKEIGKAFSINWLVPQKNQAIFEQTAKFLGLQVAVIGQPGDEIQGVMSPIKVSENDLGISITAPDVKIYHAEQTLILANAAYEGILPDELRISTPGVEL